MPTATASGPRNASRSDRFLQHTAGEQCRDDDARLAHGGDRSRGCALQREEDERVRAERGEARDDRRRPPRIAQHARARGRARRRRE